MRSSAARGLEVNVTSSDANKPGEIESALQVLASRRVDVVIVLRLRCSSTTAGKSPYRHRRSGSPRSTDIASTSLPAGLWATAWVWAGAAAVQPLSWVKSLPALGRGTFRAGFPGNMRLWANLQTTRRD